MNTSSSKHEIEPAESWGQPLDSALADFDAFLQDSPNSVARMEYRERLMWAFRRGWRESLDRCPRKLSRVTVVIVYASQALFLFLVWWIRH